jgi:hypothetical protein
MAIPCLLSKDQMHQLRCSAGVVYLQVQETAVPQVGLQSEVDLQDQEEGLDPGDLWD